ncbi:MAG TPA: alpha/beta hydrolase [Anaerolineales bacterium]|nr:alpha/beta hydrolase [Anaerolineales bacterium]
MSSILTSKGLLHYEVQGQGKPVILLHGWMGSWRLWHSTIQTLSKNYRTYAVDFWGFGDSWTTGAHTVTDFVEMVHDFMNQLGIEKAPVIGHSMGGTVTLMLAVHYPNCVEKVGVIGSPLQGSSLSIQLKLIGQLPVAWLAHRYPWIFRISTYFYTPVSNHQQAWRDMALRDFQNTTLQSFCESIQSLKNTDISQAIQKIQQPVIAFYGKKDNVVSPQQADVLRKALPKAYIVEYPTIRHFPMLEIPEHFMGILKDFLAGNTTQNFYSPSVEGNQRPMSPVEIER